MTRRNSSTPTAGAHPTRKPRRITCRLTLVEDPPITTAPIAPGKPTRPPRRGHRTPQRCTMGAQHYDERHGERIAPRTVPKLRLTGRWLEHCGFAVGDTLHITVGRGLLLVSRHPHTPNAPAPPPRTSHMKPGPPPTNSKPQSTPASRARHRAP